MAAFRASSGALPVDVVRVLLAMHDAGDARRLDEAMTASGRGFVVTRVASQGEALALLAAWPDAVVVLDMTAAGGFEALIGLLAHVPDAAVVALTGSDEAIGERAVRAGAQDFLPREGLEVRALCRAVLYARERMEVTRALLRAESRYRQIIESAPDAVITVEPSGAILDWNPRAEALFGWARAEVIGRTLQGTVAPHGPDEDRTADPWRLALGAGGARDPCETMAACKDGSRVPVELVAVRTGNQAAPSVTLFLRDITERTGTAARLRAEKEFTDRLIASLPGVFYLFDATGRLLRWNEAFQGALGYTAGDLADVQVLDLIAPEDRPRMTERIAETLRNGSASLDAMLLARDGRRVRFHLSGVRVEVDGRPCVLGVGMDLTERERMEERLLRAQKMESVGRLAGGVAHDFNNTLGAVVAFAEVALMSTGPDDPRRADIEAIKEAAASGADLTRQLLVFSRSQLTDRKVLSTNRVIAGLDKMLRRVMGDQVELVTVFGPDAGAIEIDPGRLESALVNLAINARDAMGAGGTLTIETSGVELGAGDLARQEMKPGSYVRMTVSDTGHGMSDEVRRRAFEPFFTTKPPGKGTGLGLATIYQIVRQAGGQVQVDSGPGRGATFVIDLPRVAAEPDAAAAASPAVQLRGDETILLVEDNDLARRAFGAMLTAFGYRVLPAVAGDDALAVAGRHEGRIHLVLTDVVMPRMTADELHRRMAELRPDARVLLMSGYTDDSTVRDRLMERGLPFIAKPFTADALALKVREVLGA